ncbi:MAG TPA: FGGY family carbohydrate kinase, partial [Nitrospirota bacterium]|nr:FGGY family carbohydrate kinase [Nitrospirota bacterium]
REIVRSVQESMTEAAEALRPAGIPLLGIGLSCQRSSCLAWDESTGEPLSPVISWRDTRGKDLVHALAEHAPRVFTLSGLPLTPYYSASKFRWLRENVATSDRNSAVFGTLSSFLIRRLTGARQDRIDHTHAARTQLMNIGTLAWDGDLIELFGLTGIRLPEITPSAHEFGMIATSAGPVPLLASIGDQQAAMLGLGVVGKEDAGINYGTGGFLMVNTGAGLLPAKGLMASVHYSSDAERHYLIEGSVNAVGDALEWARTRLGLFREYGEVDDLCWKAATDVIAFIGLNGTGAPHWETDIPSAFHGLRPESSSADMVRAVVEGIVFFMKDIAEAVAEAGIRPRNFVLAGGLSSLTYLGQVQADILGTDVRIGATQEASAMGAAFLAGMRHGTWTAEDIKRMTAPGEIVKGEANPGLERRYRKWKELHRILRETG